MAGNPGLTWTSDTLSIGFAQAKGKAAAYLSRTTDYYSLRSMASAKTKAPWTDRSGNARGGLFSTYKVEVNADNSVYQIDLYHRVNYGFWLEVRWNGKWGIINKTIESEGPKFFAMANQVMANMFGGS